RHKALAGALALPKVWRTADIAEAVGDTVVWVRNRAGHCNEGEPEALLDGHRDLPGNPPLLDDAGRTVLKRVIEGKIRILPPCLSELQLAERVWTLLDKPLVKAGHETVDGATPYWASAAS